MRQESHMAIFRKSVMSYRFYVVQESYQGLLIPWEVVQIWNFSLAIMLSRSTI